MKPKGCPETSVRCTNIRCVTTHKIEDVSTPRQNLGKTIAFSVEYTTKTFLQSALIILRQAVRVSRLHKKLFVTENASLLDVTPCRAENGYWLWNVVMPLSSVNRRKMLEEMNGTKISQKLIRLTEMTMESTKALVKINNRKTKTFELNTGVKQGNGLSTTLFIIALHRVIRKIDQRGKIFNKLSQICAYADDIVLITRTRQKLTLMHEHLETEALVC